MYAAQWPDFCVTAETPSGDISAYSESGLFIGRNELILVLGKHEPPPPDPNHHGHLTALSISPASRGIGLARVFMDILEALSGSKTLPPEDSGGGEKEEERVKKDAVDAWFVDLFVRCNNTRAAEMYEKLGYSVYRRVVE